ncbi:unnamed protein product [Didymodactylos carnosus]|uniref:NAD(P)(+)--arginine ADP-ribosyltransferase n=1 Tax=Didymodactylos carnosus TaxID=1234261 RepID=A0A8S2P4H4_9BILA|nr:unnamed protein product [Didymodactylos carnosus]CAF4034801.1 unnamed protein product [Didymodactylos carnosus]
MEPGPRVRYVDIGDESVIHLEPIGGYGNLPLVSLEMAVEPLKAMINKLPESVWIAKANCQHPRDNLTQDESAAIRLYTMGSIHKHLNEMLRSKNRAKSLPPWLPYLKLLLTALCKLPAVKKTVWRGTNVDLSTLYEPGDKRAWWGFSSCTESIEVADPFLGISGCRTLFCIECESGRLITPHSQIEDENEILLLPGFYFQVVGMRKSDDGFPIIHVKEVQPQHRLLESPFSPNERADNQTNSNLDIDECISIKPNHPTYGINVIETGEQNRIAAAANKEQRSILSCVKNSDAAKLNSFELVQAGELMYIGKKRDEILSVIVTQFRQTNNFPLFVDECLIPIMYLIKRYQNLDDFMEALSSKLSQIFLSVTELPKVSLRILIHFLLMKCDVSLSRMIMTLLSKRNPVPFLNPSTTTSQYSIVPEIILVWNYEMPTLLSFGIGQCSGKSTLLNALFMSTFEESSSSIYFQQTIDIDFGYGFLRTSPRCLNIADTHGRMTKQLLCKIHELFDGFLLHVDYSYLLKNIETVLDFSDILTSRKFCLLLIRDSPSSQLNQNDSLVLTRVSSRIQTFTLPSIANQNEQSKQLIRTLSEILVVKQTFPSPTNDKDFIKNELKRLISDNNYKEHLTEIERTITPLKLKLLQLVRNENYVEKYYPEYSNFVELCKL